MDINIEDLTVAYKSESDNVLTIEGLTLSVPKGEVLALVGESGCGKSTLLRVLAGIIKDYQGKVTIGNEAIDPKKQKIGYLPQNYGLLPWKNVEENILLGAKLRKYTDYDKTLSELVRRLGLTEYRLRYPRELSGGQQQRVGLARAYLLKPDVLFMDEPFSALDALTRDAMQAVFLELRSWERSTTILVTHHIEEAVALGDRIAIMTKPKGRIAEIIKNPFAGKAFDDKLRLAMYELKSYVRRRILELGETS